MHQGNVRDELIMNMLFFHMDVGCDLSGWYAAVMAGALMGRSGSVSDSSLFPKKDFYSYLMYIIF